jgi:hypothetical protein
MYSIQFGFSKYNFFYYVNIKTKAIDLKSEIERVAYLV